MEQPYDIDLVSRQVLTYLTKTYPIPPKRDLKWSSKVVKPELRWAFLNLDTFGECSFRHRGLIMYLNYNLSYTKELLIDTIAHEYRHMMQNKALYAWYRNRMKVGYWDHPLEKDARAFAEQVTQELSHLLD